MSVWLERDKMPLTLNVGRKAGVWGPRRELADWRAWAHRKAIDDGYPPLLGRVTVTVTHLRKTRASLPDLGAPMWALKGALDGIVDASVLPDDGPSIVTRLTFEVPEVVGYHGLRIVIREIEQHAPATGVS